ncbi:MAG TPA: response regulator, partial [Allocoleopsis sp.]
MKILLVEDDQATCTLLEKALAMYYRVEVAADGRSALALAQQFEYDLLLLDISIPDVDGIQVCQQLRAQGYQLPILLLTAKDGAGNRIVGLDAGADDYMTKPFYVPELLARIRALLRRRQTPIASIVTWENLRLDYLSQEVRYGEQRLRLTPKEYGILELLLLNPQRIFSRAVMIDRLWELDEPPTESAISSHIKAIRQKLKAAGATQDLIETVYGFGYRLRPLEVRPLADSPLVDSPLDSPLADSVKGIQPEHSALPTSFDHSAVESSHLGQATSDRIPTAAVIMAELWERFKNSFKTQLDSLEAVALALRENTVTADLWQEAKQTVHKLVGSLGMYGFPQGSVVAKQIETLLRLDRPLEPTEIQQLTLWIGALRQELSRSPSIASASPPSSPQLPLVLVVDDDEVLTTRLQVEASLRSLRLITAPNPIAAQSLLARTCPDVILLDLSFVEGNQDGLKWL